VRPQLEVLEDRVTPTAVTYHGGAIMNNVQVENIFYGAAWNTPANQQLQARINQFTAYLVQSPYMDMLSQYTGNGLLFGNNYVGRGNLYGSVVYEGSVSGTVTSASIENTLIQGVLGPNGTGGGGLPALPNFNNLYVVYLPPGVNDDVALKEDAYAYHSHISLAGPPWNIPPDAPINSQIQYVIAPYPGQGVPQPPYIPDPFDALTVAISHELAESVTNPNLIWGNQYANISGYGAGWYENTNFVYKGQQILGQEIGDLAQGYTGRLNGYLVQAEWSNANNGPVLPLGATWTSYGSGSSGATGATTSGQMTGPIGNPDHYQIGANGLLFVSLAQGVLSNDTDMFHNPLQAVLVSKPHNGQLQLAQDGSFFYVPAAGYIGTDSFTYAPSNGAIVGAPVTVTIDVTAPSKIGVFSNGTWYLDTNGNGTWNGQPPDTTTGFGFPGAIPVVGNWGPLGNPAIGVYYNGQWWLDTSGDGTWNPVTDKYIGNFGFPGAIPVVGNWGPNGSTDIGVYFNGTWYLNTDGTDVWKGNGNGGVQYSFGFPGALPVVGDWTNTGVDRIGVYYNGQWYLDTNGNGNWDGPSVDRYVPNFGWAGPQPVVGNWGPNHTTAIGVYFNGSWYLDTNGDSNWDAGDTYYSFGFPGTTAVVGDWQSPPLPQKASGPGPGAAVLLTQQQLSGEIQVALHLLQQAGASSDQVAELSSAQYVVGNLPGNDLGLTYRSSNVVMISASADGWGWFVDSDPGHDSYYVNGTALPGTPAADHMDLLSTIVHEMGHILGLPDRDLPNSSPMVMNEVLTPGTRHLSDLDAFFASGRW
jgi:hypothetical protein